VRSWGGDVHTVTALDKGFEHKGKQGPPIAPSSAPFSRAWYTPPPLLQRALGGVAPLVDLLKRSCQVPGPKWRNCSHPRGNKSCRPGAKLASGSGPRLYTSNGWVVKPLRMPSDVA
jgi:hypothetical protein